ncbi:MAG: hypothetical protein LBS30_05550 [Planctomycetota bacterium]|jgi:hypothetical protein|nr:hypothetical protein [Planctomycetota bacterium]
MERRMDAAAFRIKAKRLPVWRKIGAFGGKFGNLEGKSDFLWFFVCGGGDAGKQFSSGGGICRNIPPSAFHAKRLPKRVSAVYCIRKPNDSV